MDCHCLYTHDLPKDNPNKFSRASPSCLDETYRTLMDPESGVIPSPDRIVQDFEKVFMKSLPEMVQRKGLVDSGNQNRGVRYQVKEKYSDNWGGRRIRQLAYDDYGSKIVHPRALEGMKVKVEKSVRTFGQVQLPQPREEVTNLLDPVDVDVVLELVVEGE